MAWAFFVRDVKARTLWIGEPAERLGRAVLRAMPARKTPVTALGFGDRL